MKIEQVNRSLTKVVMEDRREWYSYQTLVAFEHPRTGLVVHENKWSRTTAKHLSMIDGGSTEAKAARTGAERFAYLYGLATGRLKRGDPVDHQSLKHGVRQLRLDQREREAQVCGA